MLSLLGGGAPEGAQASGHCITHEDLFWGDKPNGVWRSGATGTRNEIELKDRDIAPDCVGLGWMNWSTAHVSLGGIYGNFAEVGWRRSQDGFPTIFSEWGLNFQARYQRNWAWPCSPAWETFDEFAVVNVTGTTNWNVWVDCLNGQASTRVDTLLTTGFSTGTPTGETGRGGGTNTGMADIQRALEWRNASAAWSDWINPECRQDAATNWDGRQTSTIRYVVEKVAYDSSPSCF